MAITPSRHPALRWVAGAVTAGLAVTALTSCASSGSDAEASSSTLRVQVEASKLAGFEAVAESFEAQNDGVNVEYETITSDQKSTTNGLTLASSEAPDLGLAPINATSYTQLLYGGALEPLDDVWDEADLWNRYDEQTVQSLSGGADSPSAVLFEKQFYNIVYFNKAVFDELGISVPESRQIESNDELYSVVDALHAANYESLCIGGTSNYQFGWLFDGQLATNTTTDELSAYLSSGQPDGAEVDYTDPAVVDSLSAIQEWNEEGVFQAGVLGQNYDTALANFVAGSCGMLLGTATTVSALESNGIGFDYDWMLLPGGEEPTLPAIYAGSTFVIPNQARNVDLAKEFLAYLLSAEAQTEYITANGTLPAVSDIDDETLKEVLPELVAGVLSYVNENGSAAGWTSVVPGELGQAFIDPAIQRQLNGENDSEGTAQELQQNYESFKQNAGATAE